MAYLIDTVDDLKKHLVLSATFDFKKILPYRNQAERTLIIRQIGRTQYQEIVSHEYDPASYEPINLVKNLLCEAAANYALLLGLPTISMHIGNTGLKTTETTESKSADWKDKRDLIRSLTKTANSAIDSAFEIMEAHPDQFDEWSSSELFTIFRKDVVRHTKDFNRFFDIQSSRATFMALKPYMNEVEEQYLLPFFGECTLDFIKQPSTVPVVERVQELTKKAVVAFTVAKAAETGTFSFTASSLSLSSEELPWERSKLELDEEKLTRLRASRQKAGEEYLKRIKPLLVANPVIFNCYIDKAEVGIDSKIIKKKSGLTL